ncbi:hypothetical protein RBH29_16175 [Herbivorax sp. ANBcel31]|uniref:hypothetical protein n=1 Tax=Herbivorax sp. ANBcel31 TaxID=3069754 RepID=UPI0027B690B1|nr:hypothetical protein [Herbivorax sp. ANBcel31]MDQ2087967.1 hypothetical protein [Herbivorax sp. ANBcel31]
MVKITINANTIYKAEELFEKYYKQFGNIISAEMENSLSMGKFKLTLINEEGEKIIINKSLTSGDYGKASDATIRVLKKAGFTKIEEAVHSKKSFKFIKDVDNVEMHSEGSLCEKYTGLTAIIPEIKAELDVYKIGDDNMEQYYENKSIHSNIDEAINRARENAKKRNESNTDFYYHYMRKDTLEKILESKSLRLTRLDKVRNNQTEFDRAMNENDAKKWFVGCFTNTCEESIYFWDEYTSKKGIRLGFKKILFNQRGVYYYPESENKNKVLIPEFEKRIEDGKPKWHQTKHGLDMLDIIYSDGDYFYTNPNLTSISEDENNHFGGIKESVTVQLCNIFHIGHVKNKQKWSKESETRIRLFIEHIGTPDFEYIYIPFENESFSEIEILFNPWMKVEEKNEIIKMAKEILPKSKLYVKDSKLKTDLE